MSVVTFTTYLGGKIVSSMLISAAFASLYAFGKVSGGGAAGQPALLAHLYYGIDSPLHVQIHDFMQLNPVLRHRVRTAGPLDNQGRQMSLRTTDGQRIDGDQAVISWLLAETQMLTKERAVIPYSWNTLRYQIPSLSVGTKLKPDGTPSNTY